MQSARIATVGTGLALLAWVAKGIAIWAAGGLDKSAFESPLFFLGLLSYVVGSFAFGFAMVTGRALPVRVGAGVVTTAVAFLLIGAFQAMTRAVLPDSAGWVTEEAGLWLSAAILVAATQLLLGRRPQGRPASAF